MLKIFFLFFIFFFIFIPSRDSFSAEPKIIQDSIRDLTVQTVKWSENKNFSILSKVIDIYPCKDCHASMEVNPKHRKLTAMHTDIKLKHNKTFTWCLDCHDANNRNMLKLINNKLVPFTESYRICAQCHGTKARDWKLGIHGLRTGGWNKNKTMRNCAICHNPHTPKFGTMKPDPIPNPRRPKTNMLHNDQNGK